MTERNVVVYRNAIGWFMVYEPDDEEDCIQFMKEINHDFDVEYAMNGILSDNGKTWYVERGNADCDFCGVFTIPEAIKYIEDSWNKYYESIGAKPIMKTTSAPRRAPRKRPRNQVAHE